jgi:protease-4
MTAISRGGDAIGIVKIYGEIYSGSLDSPFGFRLRTSDYIVHRLDSFLDNDRVKAIIVRINSPGGAVGASQEIHNKILEIRESGKPVVVSMADLAASGGYYVASAADHIVANPGTLTGSIGVILLNMNFRKLMEKWGIEAVVFKSGKYKDMLAFYRETDENEKKLLQELVDTVHYQFIQAVARGRNLSEEAVTEIADGRVMTGEDAVRLNLVDELGDIGRAVEVAKEMGEIEGDVEILDREIYWNDFFQLFASSGTRTFTRLFGFEKVDYLPLKYLYVPMQ